MLGPMAAAVKRPVTPGKERGRVAHGEVDAFATAHGACAEMVEDPMAMPNDIGVHVAEGAPDGGAPPPARS